MQPPKTWLGPSVVGLGVLVAIGILSVQSWTARSQRRHVEILRLVSRIQHQLPTIHLWLEEAVADDPDVDLDRDVRQPLDSVREYLANTRRTVASDPSIQQLLDRLAAKLDTIRSLVDVRWQQRTRSGMTGGVYDRTFDRLHSEIVGLCDTLGADVDARVQADARAMVIANVSTTVIVLLLFGLLALTIVRLQRTTARDQRALAGRVVERTRELEEANRDLQRTRDRADAANHAKSEFLANMSHEVRTPLNAILGMTSLLKSSRDDPKLHRKLDVIESAGRSLLDLLTRTLRFSRAEMVARDIARDRFSPAQVLDELVELNATEAEAKGVELRWSGAAGDAVLGDPSSFRQIAQNLVSNAIKFTDDGHVEISLSLGGQLTLEVSDTGPGIPPELRSDIFEPFTQVDSSRTRRHGGVGLGLAICQQLTGLMGGKLEVESELDEGSCFRVQLPFPLASESAGEAHRQSVRHPVLVVDDQEVNRLLLCELLSHLGHSYRLAASGSEALEQMVAGNEFSLILMDCSMPDLDGYETTRRIRALHPKRHVPIVALTARVESKDRQLALESGMDDFLAKPISVETLAATVARWVDKPAAATTPPATPPLDSTLPWVEVSALERLSELSDEGTGFTRRLIELFLKEVPQLFASIEVAEEPGQPPMQAAAHRLRSSAANMGARRLAESCRQLEEASADRDRDRLIQHVRLDLAATCDALERYRNETKGAAP